MQWNVWILGPWLSLRPPNIKEQTSVILFHWRLVTVTLLVAFDFWSKILEGGGDLPIVTLLKQECSINGADNVSWWEH